jgi:hypothetical protein
VAPTLSQNGKSKRFGSILSRIEKLLSQQLTPSSLVRSRADKRLASATVCMADRENSFLAGECANARPIPPATNSEFAWAPPASFLCGLGRPSAADCIFLRRAWQRSGHGRDFTLLLKEHFSVHGAAVRTFEAVDCKINANWMWPDHAGFQGLAALWANIVHKEIEGQGVSPLMMGSAARE